MHSHVPSIIIDEIDIKLIEQLNKYLELIINHIKTIKYNSNLTNNLLKQIRIDLHQRYELRNHYYHRKFPLVLHNLYFIKSNKNHFQLLEKKYYHSIKFYKKIFNIQSLNNIEQYYQQFEQSIKLLNELKINVNQYEYDIDQLKKKLIEQNEQINIYSNNLFQIQFEQNQIQSNIQQLKQKILFEKRLYNQIKQQFIFNPKLTFKIDDRNLHKFFLEKQPTILNKHLQNQLHTECIHLSIKITQLAFNIEQKSVDLLLLQFQLYIYCTILNMNDITFTKSIDQPLLAPTTTSRTEEIHPVINKINENIIHSEQQQLPIESISKTECTKFKLRKSKTKYDAFYYPTR